MQLTGGPAAGVQAESKQVKSRATVTTAAGAATAAEVATAVVEGASAAMAEATAAVASTTVAMEVAETIEAPAFGEAAVSTY